MSEIEVAEKESQSPLIFRLGVIWGVWTIVALFFSTQAYIMYFSENHPIPYAQSFFVQASACYLWALVTPFVLWLSRNHPIDRNKWKKKIAAHVALSFLLVSALIVMHFVVYMFIVQRPDLITPMNTFAYFYPNLDRWLLVYWFIFLMSHAFNYYRSYRQGELRAAKLRTELLQAQLEALKMQVHPHFLFNTLHSISALLNKDTEAARKMITRLGDFLRLTLENAGQSEVTLRQEIEFLNGYLEIEEIRFRGRLTTDIFVDPTILDAQVPNLILQPLVENAMRHAIANSASGKVEIEAVPRNGFLHIEVRDNGCGLTADSQTVPRKKGGIGLTNTRARLHGLYGPSARLELSNRATGGLIVTLEIPRRAATELVTANSVER